MCGIVGYVGKKQVVPVIIDGLRRLEYRGYDSAGIAVAGGPEGLQLRRAEGKLRNLEEVIRQHPIDGTYGIGHTRWATHGRPSEENAHPHRDCSGTIVVVHNGIVENYLQLKKMLREEGHTYKTETDTEVIAHLIEKFYILENKDKKLTLEEAVRKTVKMLQGVFALAVISSDSPNKIIASRNGPPAVIGLGKDEYFVASDVPAILYHTRDLFFLGDGDVAVLTPEGVTLTDFDGKPVEREVQHITWDPIMAEKGGFKHFMLKEIYEQPRAVRDTALGRISQDSGKVFLEQMDVSEEEFRNLRKLNIAACGTSWHAGLAGKYMIERLARVPVEVDYASEFRYRNPLIGENEMTLVITQSGETADTIAAQRECKARGAKTIAICNVVGAMIAREADGTIYTHAGPEIGVASTKAFTAQLVALFLLALRLGQIRGTVTDEESVKLAQELSRLPGMLETVLSRDEETDELARIYQRVQDFLFLGRGIHFPIALEGALKLKEISYIHAEGYAAGELKHGPIALIDENMPVVVIAPFDRVFEKTVSNMQEVAARGGNIILMTDAKGAAEATIESLVTIVLPDMAATFTPMVYAVPVQLLAYHTAVIMGTDVDQPRNLAKSVTVE
jgi:glucosamine--fructose-6-phosphate aminotransferase (isomerizing)